MTEQLSKSAHLDPHEIAGYIEGRLDPAARASCEAHLSDCEECAAELAEVARMARGSAPPVRWLGLVAAAAAVIAVVVLGRPEARPDAVTTPAVRGDTGTPAVSMVQPVNGATLSAPPVFVWRSVPGAAAYRITISRADGDSVWAASVRDTVARAPETAFSADTYYWYVDAILSDGTSRAGAARRFRLAP